MFARIHVVYDIFILSFLQKNEMHILLLQPRTRRHICVVRKFAINKRGIVNERQKERKSDVRDGGNEIGTHKSKIVEFG